MHRIDISERLRCPGRPPKGYLGVFYFGSLQPAIGFSNGCLRACGVSHLPASDLCSFVDPSPSVGVAILNLARRFRLDDKLIGGGAVL